MCAVESTGYLNRMPECFLEGTRTPPQPIRQGLALEVLEYEVVRAILTADVVERADVRILQRCDALCFTFEARLQILIFRRQDLYRDDALQPVVASFVNLAHAPGSDRGDDLVRSQTCA